MKNPFSHSKLPVTLAILLGGQSRRMGFPKHKLRHKKTGLSLLQSQIECLAPHFEETLLLAGKEPLEEDFELPRQVLDPEEFAGFGPLAGLLAACRASNKEMVALLACDYPMVTADFFGKAHAQLGPSKDPGLVFRDPQGHPQWLCGLYRTNLAAELQSVLEQGGRAVRDFATKVDLKPKAFPETLDPGCVANLNTLEQAERLDYCSP